MNDNKFYSTEILLEAGAMASTGTIYSDPITTTVSEMQCLQAIWTGTPTGTLSIEASLDGSNWSTTTYTFSSSPAGSASSSISDLSSSAYPYFKACYVNTSGTGVLKILGFKKGMAW